MTQKQAEQAAQYAATRFNRTYYIVQRGNYWTYTPEASAATHQAIEPDPAQVAKYEGYWGHRSDPKDAGAQRERLARTNPTNSVY